MGRFLSPDWSARPSPVPFADFSNPQTLNLYQYAHNNPTSMDDPDGHCPQCLGALFGAATGAVQILYQTGKVVVTGKGTIPTNREIAGKLLGGAIAGAIGGAPSGSIVTNVITKGGVEVVKATATQQVMQSGVGAVVGGIVDRGVSTGDSNKALDLKAVGTDAALGGLSGAAAVKLTNGSQLSQNTEYLTNEYASPSAVRPESTSNLAVGDTTRSMTTQLDTKAAVNGAATGTAVGVAQTAAEKKKPEDK